MADATVHGPARAEKGVDSRAADAPAAPPATLATFALAAIAARVLSDKHQQTGEVSFLRMQLEIADPGRVGWMPALVAYMQSPHAIDRPLLRLAATLGLTTFELLTVAVSAAVEEQVMVGRAVAHVQAPVGASRPTVALLGAVLAQVLPTGASAGQTLLTGVGVTSGLLAVNGESLPLPERTVSVPLHLVMALRGADSCWPGTTIGIDSAGDVPLPASTLQEARRQAAALTVGSQHVLVLRAASRAEGKAVAQAIASAIGRTALFMDTPDVPGLGPWAALRQLVPVFCLDLTPGERKVLAPIPSYAGPVLALATADGSVESSRDVVTNWRIPVPAPFERHRLWSSAIGDDELAYELARDHRHGAGRIAHLGRLARHEARVNGRAGPNREDVVAAAWTGEGAGLDALAQPLRQAIPHEALVAPPLLRRQLDLLLDRCRSRDRIGESLGASITARYQPGVRALFVGPSGTGKTLAASWVATRLGLPIYRVDLASVTSKYIGETEKNLAQLLARAEQAEIILLFDEADSLFGKRTEVTDARDRYANLEVSYLLQRLEVYDGLVVLATNFSKNIDEAFLRRIHVAIEFPLPQEPERKLIWQHALPKTAPTKDIDLDFLAKQFDLAGGSIKGAALHAAFLAAEEGTPITMELLMMALKREFQKLGRLRTQTEFAQYTKLVNT
jgi:hypothetical protein